MVRDCRTKLIISEEKDKKRARVMAVKKIKRIIKINKVEVKEISTKSKGLGKE